METSPFPAGLVYEYCAAKLVGTRVSDFDGHLEVVAVMNGAVVDETHLPGSENLVGHADRQAELVSKIEWMVSGPTLDMGTIRGALVMLAVGEVMRFEFDTVEECETAQSRLRETFQSQEPTSTERGIMIAIHRPEGVSMGMLPINGQGVIEYAPMDGGVGSMQVESAPHTVH